MYDGALFYYHFCYKQRQYLHGFSIYQYKIYTRKCMTHRVQRHIYMLRIITPFRTKLLVWCLIKMVLLWQNVLLNGPRLIQCRSTQIMGQRWHLEVVLFYSFFYIPYILYNKYQKTNLMWYSRKPTFLQAEKVSHTWWFMERLTLIT